MNKPYITPQALVYTVAPAKLLSGSMPKLISDDNNQTIGNVVFDKEGNSKVEDSNSIW